MTESIRLPAVKTKPATVALPGSKSISNRSLLLAALSDNVCEIHSLLKSDDTDRMLDALAAMWAERNEKPPMCRAICGKACVTRTLRIMK